jgi:hypothetical protein
MTLRLRVLKRHTSLEVSLEEFMKIELVAKQGGFDLNLSVFDIDAESVVHTHAEFVVSFLDPEPKKTRGGLSLSACDAAFDAIPCPATEMLFEYAKSCHLELRFLREADLRVLATQIYNERAVRQLAVSGAAVIGYGRNRLAAGDEEWTLACEVRPRWKKELSDE